MERTEQQLRELEQQLNEVSSKTPRRLWSMFAIMLGGLFLIGLFSFWYIQIINSRFDDLEQAIISQTQAEQSQPATNGEIDSLRGRIQALESLQEAIVSTSKGALEQMNFVFTIVAAFFGLFALFFAYREVVADTSREGHDQEMRGLVQSFQNNITTISSLISTLEQSFAYRKEIESQLGQIRERAESLEEERRKSDKVFSNLIESLNARAVELFDVDTDRANLSLAENRSKLESFSDRVNSAGTTREIEDLLNPFCYYLRGLNSIATYEYQAAIEAFETAYRKGLADLDKRELETYAAAHRVNIEKHIKEMLVSCSHFQGVSYKNIGDYAQSRNNFQKAITDSAVMNTDSRLLQSSTYLLQVMFFDESIPFEAIEREYERTIEKFEELEQGRSIDRERLKKSFNILKINQGNMHLIKTIPFGFRSDYQKFEDQEKALKYYWEAYDYLDNDLATFSVAQAMEILGPSEWRRTTPKDLYREARRSLQRRVAQDPDHLYSVMLYYMLAICAHKLPGSGERPESFLSQARHSLRAVPTHVTCFSPINKIRLDRSQIIEEIERFERTLEGGV